MSMYLRKYWNFCAQAIQNNLSQKKRGEREGRGKETQKKIKKIKPGNRKKRGGNGHISCSRRDFFFFLGGGGDFFPSPGGSCCSVWVRRVLRSDRVLFFFLLSIIIRVRGTVGAFGEQLTRDVNISPYPWPLRGHILFRNFFQKKKKKNEKNKTKRETNTIVCVVLCCCGLFFSFSPPSSLQQATGYLT